MFTKTWITFYGAILLCLLPVCSFSQGDSASTLRVPAFTAYLSPDPEAAEVSEERGITGWKDKYQYVVWYGYIKTPGKLALSLQARSPVKAVSRLRLTVAGQSTENTIIGAGSDIPLTFRFGEVNIHSPGYYAFILQGLSKDGKTFGDLEALLLNGPAVEGAHFNMKERRNAASVHLGYPFPAETKATWFYNEVTVKTDPIWSYYMACGFKRGYFGIQVNSPTERRVIFSVWDSGNEAVDRNKVDADNRVQLLAKGEGVSRIVLGTREREGIVIWSTPGKQAKPIGSSSLPNLMEPIPPIVAISTSRRKSSGG